MKFLAHALIVSLIAVPFAHGDQIGSTDKSATVVRGSDYLSNCRDILSVPSNDYENHLTAAADNESQVLQLLFDGGLIFSKLYSEAFIQALDSKFEIRNAAMQFKQIKYSKKSKFLKQLAQKLAKLARLPTAELNAFIWQILDVEQQLAAASQNSSDLKNQIRYEQVTKLIGALKTAPNRELVEATLRDVVTESLMISARQLFMGSLNRLTRNFDDQNPIIVIGIAGTFGGALGTLLGDFAVNAVIGSFYPYGIVPDHVAGPILLGSAFTGFFIPTAFGFRYYIRKRGLEAAIKSNDAEKKYYVLPRGTSEERLEIAGLLTDFFESPTPEKGQNGKGNKTPKLKKSDWRDETPNNQLSIADACNSNTCELSPIQLAYVGDIDLLELQGLLARLRESIATYNAPTVSLRQALSAVQDDPRDYEKTMDLRVKLEELRQFSTEVSSAEHELLNQVDQKVAQLRTDFALLRAKPFSELRKSSEDRARGLLLLNRVNADLAKLDRFSFDVQRYRNSVSRIEKYSNATVQWLNSLPLAEHGWREAATNIRQQLDQLEAHP